MFEKALEEKLKRIFHVKKVVYDQPGESREQDCIFIEVEQARNRVSDARFLSRVNGNLIIFGRSKELPFGFFSKAIAEADLELTHDIAFFDFELNSKYFRDLVQRTVSFVYFFDSQYDPDVGSITSMTTDIEVTP